MEYVQYWREYGVSENDRTGQMNDSQPLRLLQLGWRKEYTWWKLEQHGQYLCLWLELEWTHRSLYHGLKPLSSPNLMVTWPPWVAPSCILPAQTELISLISPSRTLLYLKKYNSKASSFKNGYPFFLASKLFNTKHSVNTYHFVVDFMEMYFTYFINNVFILERHETKSCQQKRTTTINYP